MTTEDAADRRPRLFTVRLWLQRVADGVERRGSVRAVDSGAFRNFREWSDLTLFLVEQLDDQRPVPAGEPTDISAPWGFPGHREGEKP